MKLNYQELLEFLKDKEYCQEEGLDCIVYKTIHEYEEEYFKIKGGDTRIVQTSEGLRPSINKLNGSVINLVYEVIPLDYDIEYVPRFRFIEIN